jgi:hypothetical protein
MTCVPRLGPTGPLEAIVAAIWLPERQAAPRAFVPRGRNPNRAEVKLTTRSTGPMATHGKCPGRAQEATDLSRNDPGAVVVTANRRTVPDSTRLMLFAATGLGWRRRSGRERIFLAGELTDRCGAARTRLQGVVLPRFWFPGRRSGAAELLLPRPCGKPECATCLRTPWLLKRHHLMA